MKKTLLEIIEKDYDNAEALIRSGKVLINEEVVFIPSAKVEEKSKVRVKEGKEWVSRGAYKLLEAINAFKLNFKDKVVLDIGSSTGGFSQVALKNGAKKVYALDSGSNQLDYKLRTNNKIVVMEKTNLKKITQDMFDKKIDIALTDVSFISLKEVIKVLTPFTNLEFIPLIKPQFEAARDKILKGGVVEKKHHEAIINNIISYATAAGFDFIDKTESPIKGNKSKNTEYLVYFKKGE